jgi:hypothetical protein
MLGDDHLGAAVIEFGDERVAIEGLVGEQGLEGDTFDEGRHADAVVALAGHQAKAHQIAQRVGECEDLGGHAALGKAYGLTLIPPFSPCPWRWTLTIVASTMAYSMSGSSEQASKSLMKTSALTQSR